MEVGLETIWILKITYGHMKKSLDQGKPNSFVSADAVWPIGILKFGMMYKAMAHDSFKNFLSTLVVWGIKDT